MYSLPWSRSEREVLGVEKAFSLIFVFFAGKEKQQKE